MPDLCILQPSKNFSKVEDLRVFTGLSLCFIPVTQVLKYPVYLWLLVFQSLWYDATILAKQHAVLWDEDGAGDTAEFQSLVWFGGLPGSIPDLPSSVLLSLFVKLSKVGMRKGDKKKDGRRPEMGEKPQPYGHPVVAKNDRSLG